MERQMRKQIQKQLAELHNESMETHLWYFEGHHQSQMVPALPLGEPSTFYRKDNFQGTEVVQYEASKPRLRFVEVVLEMAYLAPQP